MRWCVDEAFVVLCCESNAMFATTRKTRVARGVKRGHRHRATAVVPTLALLFTSLCVSLPLPADGTASAIRGTHTELSVDDPAYFPGPADPEAEALSKRWGTEETFVVLPRLASLGGDVPWVQQLSWSPRAQVYHNFLTPEECAHLVGLAKSKMRLASVVDRKTGVRKASEVRTSTGYFLTRGADDVVSRIEERIAAFAMIPVDHGEGMQILKYEPGQKYDPHFDYFTDTENCKHGGQRVATVILYLSDVEKGGETVFPTGEFLDDGYRAGNFYGDDESNRNAKGNAKSNAKSNADSKSTTKDSKTSHCAQNKLHVKPRRGDALLFWSVDPTGRDDSKSLHGGCAVEIGDKWTATKWIRHGPYGSARELKEKARIERGNDDTELGTTQNAVEEGGHDEN